MRPLLVLVGILGAVSVAVGAYHAHGLEKSLAEQGVEEAEIAERLEQCDVAVRYHMLHSVALLMLAMQRGPAGKRRGAAILFLLLGIALFSGGLYSMVFLGEMGHWAIVPSGGVCFILGWLFIASLGFGNTVDEEKR